MSNQNYVFGARPIRSLHNTQYGVHNYVVTDATALFIGDLVKLTGSSAENELGQVLPAVSQAAAGNAVVGVVVGFAPMRQYENQLYRTLSTTRTVFVADDPDLIFEMQSNGIAAVTDVGDNMDVIVASGSIFTGMSGMQLNESTVGPENTKVVRILRLASRVDNEMGLYAKLECMFNLHQHRITTGL
jgi:hypothetical protein